ncbi:ABC transporter permease, partial [Streptomyces nigra]
MTDAPLTAAVKAAAPAVPGPRARTTTRYLRYGAGKVGGAAVSLFAVLVTGFFLFRLIPGDPVKTMTGGRPVSAEQMAAYREEFGLDLPLWQQFTEYCGKALTGDLGTSYQFHAPVTDKIAEALPNTLLLTGTAFVLFTLLGIVLGTRSAWRHGG